MEKESKHEMVNVKEYEKQYSEEKFWDKVKSFFHRQQSK